MSLAQKTVRGVFWAYTIFFSGRFLTMISTAILARILFPADFGLIGYALLLLNFIEAARDFGIKDALIYTSDRVEDAADTAFIMNVVIGFLQYGVAFVLAPLAINFVDDPRIVLMLRLMALTFVINAFGNTHDALLQKELKFRSRYLPDLYSAVIKGTASIVFALLGYGVWSLVAGHLVGAVVRMAGRWYMQDWRPRLRFHRDRARALWDYGVYILLFSLLDIALEQADQMIIGTLLGKVQLGFYTIAARIPEMVIANFSLVLTKVLFPTYARMKDDIAVLTQGFLVTTKYTAFVTVPIGFGLVATAPELVPVVFGEQWAPAVILLQVLSLLGMVATLPWSAGDVLKAIGRPDISAKLLVFEALYTFPLIVVLTVQSRLAVMASLANLIALMITTVVRLAIVSRILKLNPLVFFRIFRAPFVGGICMLGIVTLWRMLVESWAPLAVLSTSVFVGAVVYIVILWFFEKEDILQAVRVLSGAIRRDSDDVDEINPLPAAQREESDPIEV